MRLIYCTNYYPDGRELAHLLKDGDLEAIKYVARLMASKVPADSVLIPMPSRYGYATTMLDLAMELSKLTGRPVENILHSVSRESLYDMKKRGVDIDGVNLGMYCDKEPSGFPCVIDNVYDTGKTMQNALETLGNGIGLVFAKV